MRMMVLKTTVGSHAHGLARPDSDVDSFEIYAECPSKLFSVGGHTAFDASENSTAPDVQRHEVAKFVRLAAQGNPTFLDPLFVNMMLVTDWGFFGESLRDIRTAFLSQRVIAPTLGHMRSTIERQSITPKSVKHFYRLGYTLYEFVACGGEYWQPDVRAHEFDHSGLIQSLMNLAEGGHVQMSGLRDYYDALVKSVTRHRGEIRPEPDMITINDWLFGMRAAQMERWTDEYHRNY